MKFSDVSEFKSKSRRKKGSNYEIRSKNQC